MGKLRPYLKVKYIAGAVTGLGLLATIAYFLTREPEIPLDFRMKQALKYLDENRNVPARLTAKRLEDLGYQDPDFAGGVAFVLGVVAYREADDLDEVGSEQRYIIAAGYLRQAEKLALIAERRSEWAYTLGMSLHRVGFVDDAAKYLEEAVRLKAAGRVEAALRLTETYLFQQTKSGAKRALELNTEVISDSKLSGSEHDRAYLQRTQILIALGRKADADEALAKVSKDSLGNHGSIVLRAQALMGEKKYRQALKLLEPVASDEGLERLYPGQANYLIGVCAEKLGELENAASHYDRTIERFERSHEALAARLCSANVLRKIGRNEEALESYGIVLRTVRRPKTFRNRWISLKRLRDNVVEAWNAWVEQDFYAEAITLSEFMYPAIPREQANELIAQANQRWAEHVEAEVAKLSYSKQLERAEEVRLRWKQCGKAYAVLAENRKNSSTHNDAMWVSAEAFFKGHDFGNVVAELTEFLEIGAGTLHSTALVRRGQAFMNMDRMEDALRDFQQTLTAHPTDPAAFQARYLIGQCHFERNEIELAERSWRKILESADLAPTALEWRKSLFALGKLLYVSADFGRRESRSNTPIKTVSAVQTADGAEQPSVIYTRLDESISKLEEFLDRYPTAQEAVEARFLLARCLQRSAELPQEKLKAAETDNARAEFRRQILEKLERAIQEYQKLQATLIALQTSEKLDTQGQMMLRNCFFETAHSYFSLGRYEEAIVAYGNGAGRYPREADSLTAYVQIANCYDRLLKPAEALSTLAQAQLILKQLPDEAFPAGGVGMARKDWQRWLEWAMRLHN